MNVLITGGNRGIGLALTRQYVARGDCVWVTARQPKRAEELQSLSQQAEGRLTILPLEVTQAQSVAELAAQLEGQPIDVLINNAGVLDTYDSTIDNIDFESFAQVLDVNIVGPLRVMQALMPNLRSAKGARVANLSSGMGALADDGTGAHAYRVSKAGLNKAMKVVAQELADDRITVLCLHPGWVRTDMGGSSADIDAQTSALGLISVIDAAEPADSGSFLNYDGSPIAW